MSTDQPYTADRFAETFARIAAEMSRVVVGQEAAIEQLLVAIFSGGHTLLSGMPGLGRTLMVKTLSNILDLNYSRIQFTPDLLPTDIVGTEMLQTDKEHGRRRFRFYKGPVFANLVLADEVNRSPARTQAALLEVMQEKQVTLGGQTHFLPKPFILIATQNTQESEGVWPLGEAQADRFMMSIQLPYPTALDEKDILYRTTGAFEAHPAVVAGPDDIIQMTNLATHVPVVPSVKDFALALVRASRVTEAEAPEELRACIRLGASPRTAQALIRGGKVLALARGRSHVSRQDILDIADPVLRHRLMLGFRAKAEGRDFQYVFERLLWAAEERTRPTIRGWTRKLFKFSSAMG